LFVIIFVFISVTVSISVALPAHAQQPTKIYRIGFLDNGSASGMPVRIEPFRRELAKLGWIEGKNIQIDYRLAGGQYDLQHELAADLVRLNVDLVVVAGLGAASAAKRATSTIPIVMASVGNPVDSRLVASLARPGGNVTGLSALSSDLNTKRLEILKDAIPKLYRVGMLILRGARSEGLDSREHLRSAAVALKLNLEEIETQIDAKSLENAFQTAKQKQVTAITTNANRAFLSERKRIVELAGKYRFPAIYGQREYVDDGGLMCYGADYDDLFRRAAHYVDKILKGAKPGDLPVQQATKFEFVINLKAAKQIGLTIPVRVLERANQVIK
jgi:putative ABC transport system substrate-binding protein